MAKMLSATMGRPDHYRVTRLQADTSAFYKGVCECGAQWNHDTDRDQWGCFSNWVLGHQPATIRRALRTEQCPGSGGLIHERLTDGRLGSWVGWCPECDRYRPTSDQPGYDGWRQFDAHPVFITAVTA